MKVPLGYALPSWADGEKVAVIGTGAGTSMPCDRCGEETTLAIDAAEGWLCPTCGLVSEYWTNGTGQRVEIARRPPPAALV